MKKNLMPNDPNFEWRWIEPQVEEQEKSVGKQITSPVEDNSDQPETFDFPSDSEWREITPEQQKQEDQYRSAITGKSDQASNGEYLPESRIGMVGRNIGSAFTKGLANFGPAAGTLLNAPRDIVTSLVPHGKELKEAQISLNPSVADVAEASGPAALSKAAEYLPEKFLEERNSAERIFQGVGKNLPTAVFPITGAGAATKLTKNLVTSVGSLLGSETAKEFGAGTWGQIGAGVLGSILSGVNPKGVAQQLPDLKEKAYNTARSIGRNAKVALKPFTRKLLDFEELVKDYLSGPLQKKYGQQIVHASSKITERAKKTGSYSLNDVADLDKLMNTIFFDKNTSDVAKNSFFEHIKPEYEKIVQEVAKQHPEWGNAYNTGKNLNTFIKGSKNFEHIFEDKEVSNLFRDIPIEAGTWILSALAGGDIGKGLKFARAIYKGPKYAKNFIINQGLNKSAIKEIAANPATRKVASDMIVAAADNNKGAIITALKSLK